MQKNLLTLGYVPFGTGKVSPFDKVFGKRLMLDPFEFRDEFKKCDAIVVWGGADISPTIYNEPVSKYTGADVKLSHRDIYEVQCMKAAIEFGIPIIGVCRGAQLACAMAGGKLIQHVEGHGGDHLITTSDGRSIITSSVHHQMMYPWDVDHQLIAWADKPRSQKHIMGNDESVSVECEPEIVFFPKIKALAIQGHPEFMDEECEFVAYCNDLVQELLLKQEEHVNVC